MYVLMPAKAEEEPAKANVLFVAQIWSITRHSIVSLPPVRMVALQSILSRLIRQQEAQQSLHHLQPLRMPLDNFIIHAQKVMKVEPLLQAIVQNVVVH
jgi:hypothetical protein